MTLTIDCTCGAHLEIDGRFASQTIQCPDCQRSLQVPAFEPTIVRTSGLALASFMLALLGAFTVIGTLAAIVLGVLGLRSIAKRPEHLRGNGYAVTGIVFGVLFTAISVFAYSKVELFGLDRLLREPQWAGKLDYQDTSQTPGDGFSIPIPSRSWARFKEREDSDNLFVVEPGRGLSESVILVNVRDDAYAIGFSFGKGLQMAANLEAYRESAMEKFLASRLVTLLLRKRDKNPPAAQIVSTTKLPGSRGHDAQEIIFDMQLGKHERTFIMRIIPGQDSLFVVAAGARKNRFAGMKTQLDQIVSGFKLQ